MTLSFYSQHLEVYSFGFNNIYIKFEHYNSSFYNIFWNSGRNVLSEILQCIYLIENHESYGNILKNLNVIHRSRTKAINYANFLYL